MPVIGWSAFQVAVGSSSVRRYGAWRSAAWAPDSLGVGVERGRRAGREHHEERRQRTRRACARGLWQRVLAVRRIGPRRCSPDTSRVRIPVLRGDGDRDAHRSLSGLGSPMRYRPEVVMADKPRMRSFELIPTRSSVPRMWGVLEVVAGAIAVIGALLAGPGAHGASVAVSTGAGLALFGVVAALVPWQRLPARATLVVPGIALAFLVLQLVFGADQLLRLGIALWLAGLTGETIAWRAELRRREELTQQAERREELVRSMVQTASDATVVIDGLGAITSASPSVTATLGYDPDDLLQSTIHALVSPEDAATILAMRPRPGTHSDGRLDCQVLHHDGRWLRAEVSITNLPDKDGLVLTIHDVTRWKELEEQLTRPGVPRSADRARQPGPVRRPPGARPWPAPPSHEGRRGPVPRSRRLQDGQRHPGPCRGRPPDPAGGRPPHRDAPAGGHGGPAWRRRVRPPARGRGRGPGRERREPGAGRARPAVRPERAADAHRDHDRHRPELAGPADGDRHAARRRYRDVRGQGRRQGPVPRVRAIDAARHGRAHAPERRPARGRRARRVRPALPAHGRACRARR